MRKNRIPKILLATVVLIAGMLMSASKGDPFETSKQLEIFTAVLREVQTQYVDEIGAEQAVGSAIKGMLRELDPYTVYYPEDQIEDVRLIQTGEYGGIGCVIQIVEDEVLISSIYGNGPAAKAGLKVGDRILAVGDESCNGKSTSEVSALLKGSAGTEVSIRVERYGTAPTLYTFKRETITQEPVPFYGLREDGIGYIYLESFTDKAGAQVRSALQNLLEKEAKGIILDLRGNGGGLLMEAVKIVSLFVEGRDTLVTTRTRNGVIQDVYKANGKPIAANLPLAVLVDENSASASEIVAGSLQDLDRAVILGEPSFGKGLVQQVHPLPFGAQMKVTIAKYYTPSGRCIQKINYDRDESGDRLAKAATKTFTTRGGRTVEDGNGIAPDSLITNEYFPEIIAALGSKGLDLKYAGRALSTLPKDASPLNFALSETQWKEFLSFLNEADFSYTSVSERRLQELEEDAEFMDYLESEDIKALKEVVAKRKNNVLVDEQEEIKDYLADYLVSKNFDLAGSLERGMEKDQIIKQAAQILQNANTMKDLLSVK